MEPGIHLVLLVLQGLHFATNLVALFGPAHGPRFVGTSVLGLSPDGYFSSDDVGALFLYSYLVSNFSGENANKLPKIISRLGLQPMFI